ncbi:universal stress protein [Jatrophihabitans sp. DSM 45814]
MTVLVSYVPSAEGFAALEAGMQAAKTTDQDLVVLNVVVGSNFADPTFAEEKDLEAVRSRIAQRGIKGDVRQALDARDVAEEVLKAADALPASLIVVGLRRKSLVGKLLLGSNAQQIILSANCPVLSVRPDLA